ncbi:cytochrome oxidase assembly factor 4 [Trichomonascus vanleenenianus]|uniref:Coa4p n=1 Tax=Trichomonascus vanleenenianus TaxID=2268995 RepID=UPI003EC95465
MTDATSPTVDKKESAQDEEEDDDEPDEWDQRIIDTGCSAENMALTDCHAEKKDWRECIKEMQAFKECWAQKMNNQRTSTRDV